MVFPRTRPFLKMKMPSPTNMIKYAKEFVGMQYKKYPPRVNLDCSSFVQTVFSKYGIHLPRTTINQAKQGMEVQLSDIQIGDLLFFYVLDKHPSDDIVGHVGIYAGNGKMIHCIPTSNIFLTKHTVQEEHVVKSVFKMNEINYY